MTHIVKTLALGLFALSAPAFAQTGATEVTATFTHDAALTAEQNYAAMVKVAEEACEAPNSTSILIASGAVRAYEAECVAELMEKGVEQFARNDLARAHSGDDVAREIETARLAKR